MPTKTKPAKPEKVYRARSKIPFRKVLSSVETFGLAVKYKNDQTEIRQSNVIRLKW